MCGIAGLFDASGSLPDRGLLSRMGQAINHRGPDQSGEFSRPGVGLVARRLRIIDLEGGAQPISNEDGSITVVFNGEIYNYQELRARLERRGHRLSTRSDTEVIVHLYEELGDEFLGELRGMFALALWDARGQRGVLARDRLGKKPVVYAHIGQHVFFASEFQALLQAPDIPRTLDVGALGDYLAYGYVPAPASIYAAARKLPPGHRLVWQHGAVRVEPYWALEYLPKLSLTESEAEEELGRRLTDAVQMRMIADVPVGALLSGGIDSSVIVALMARLAPGRVQTFSIGFDETAYDELAHARRVAERYDTEHHEFVVNQNVSEVLPVLVRHYGEPFADSSAIPTFYVCRLARGSVTVALNGDGGDETFAGYDRTRAMVWSELLRRVPGLPWGAAVGSRLWARYAARRAAHRRDGRALKLLRGLRLPAGDRYRYWTSNVEGRVLQMLLTPDCAAQTIRRRSFAVERAWASAAHLSPADRALRVEISTSLPNDLLAKMDIASMANSLETRSPFLDHELVQFAARLPARYKLRHGVHQKYLLKRLARKLVPPENIDRPKMGFGVPIGKWLRGPLRDLAAELLLSRRTRQRGYLRPDTVARLWTEHQSHTGDHASILWTVLMFELWHREFIDVPAERREIPAVEPVGEKR